MKSKNYQKPTMRIVQLRHRTHMLNASETKKKLDKNADYENGGDALSF